MIVIIGGTGTVGKHIVNACIKASKPIRVASYKEVDFDEKLIDCVLFDFNDQNTYSSILENATTLFFLRPPQMGDANDFIPFINAIDKSDVNHVVFLSLMGVEHNPFPPHHKIEKMIKNSSVSYTFIRPSFFMENLIYPHGKDILEKNQIIIPAGKAKTSFIAAKDIGEVIAKVMINPNKHQNKAYTLTGLDALTYYEVADIMSQVLQKKISYEKPSLLRYRKHMINRGFAKSYVNVTMMLYIMTRLGTAKKVTSTVEHLLGKKPTTLKKFIRIHQEYFIR